MKTVLITGADGFIGRHCLSSLKARGYEVHAIYQPSRGPGPQGAIWHEADLLDAAGTTSLMEKLRPSHLLHLAWYVVPGRYLTDSENLRWVQSSLTLLQAFQRSGGARAVLAGSCSEYDWSAPGPYSERRTAMVPATLYGTCKHALQLMLAAFSAQSSFSSAWGRVFFLYGPHEPPQRLVPSVINSLLAGEPARCTSGKQVRDFLFVQDVAAAFAALVDSEVQGPVNIASGRELTLAELITRIGRMIGREDLIQLGALPDRPTEPSVLLADVSRLRQEVGFTPAFDLEQGLDLTIQWWRQQKPMTRA